MAFEERLHTYAVQGLAEAYFLESPAKGANWIVETKEFSILPDYLMKWTFEAPTDAVEWCRDNQTYSGIDSPLAHCLQHWSKRDGKAALAWCGDLEPALHDPVIADLARFWGSNDTAHSELYLKQLHSKQLREAVTRELRGNAALE